MTTDVSWYLPGRIIYCYDVLAVEERIARNRKILHLMDTEGQPPAVHTLIDFSSTDHGNYATGLQDMIDLHESNDDLRAVREALVQHPLQGWIISVGARNPALTANANVMAGRMHYNRRSVDTLEDAIAFLKKIDNTLVFEI